MLRTKLANFEENEVSIAYLTRLEKLKGESNIIFSLLDSQGVLKEGTNNVLSIVKDFYANLYKKEPESSSEQNFFFRNIENRINVEDRLEMDRALDSDELLESLKSLRLNKSPGDDGLTAEFYKHFWTELSPIYMRVVREIKEKKSLSTSQKRGLIVLAHKKGGRELLQNYRPTQRAAPPF